MRYILHQWLIVTLLAVCCKGSVLFTRQTGPLPSFYDAGNDPGDDYIDLVDDFDTDGVDIDVTGNNYNILGTAVTHLRCFDAGWCDCGTGALTTTTADIPTETTLSTGLSLSKACLIAPYVYALDNAANKYHISYKKVAAGNNDHLLDRISEEVDLALNQYPGTWAPTNALIITWKVEPRISYMIMKDKFQAIIASKASGSTYVIFIYDTLTGIATAGSVRGMVGTSAPNFARICPKLVSPSTTPTNTAPLDADMLTDSNRNCANKGSYVFLTTAASTCTDPAASCVVDNTDANCKTAVVAQDTCTENFLCSLDATGLTVTFDFYIKWYKFARLQAITQATFIGSGTETSPQGVTNLETGATCGTDLPNPASSSATSADKFTVTITLASPECGFAVDTGAETIKFAFVNYEGNGLGDAADLNFPYDYAGKAFFWGTCYYKELGPSVTIVKEFNDVPAPTVLPVRNGRAFTFKVVDVALKADAVELTSVQVGRRYYLQICFTPGTPFNAYTDPFGIWGATCKASNDMTFPADNPSGYQRTVEFITTGCPVAGNLLDLKRAFEGDAGNNGGAPDGSEWCINAGPFTAARWNKFDTGNLVDKIFFQCVINFCSVPATEALCSDSCTTDPITRRRRSTSHPSETVFTSVDIEDDTAEEEKQCVDSTVAISTIVALNVMFVLGVSIVTIIFMKIRAARRCKQKTASVYSMGSLPSKHSRGTLPSKRSLR